MPETCYEIDRHTKPTDVLDAVIWRAILIDYYHKPWSGRVPTPKQLPGAVVFDMPPEARELLKELKSDDIANLRPDAVVH